MVRQVRFASGNAVLREYPSTLRTCASWCSSGCCGKRFHFHFNPTYGFWMNLIECWFSALTTKKLSRSAHASVKALAADIRA